jgi:nucleoside-diphosphate-sugar epimerase
VYCDPKKAQDVLGWKAKISLEESVKSGIKFYVVLANL